MKVLQIAVLKYCTGTWAFRECKSPAQSPKLKPRIQGDPSPGHECQAAEGDESSRSLAVWSPFFGLALRDLGYRVQGLVLRDFDRNGVWWGGDGRKKVGLE